MLGRLAVDGDITVPLRAQAASAGGRDQLRAARLRARQQRATARRGAGVVGGRTAAGAGQAARAATARRARRRWGGRCSATRCGGAGAGSGADLLPDHRVRAPGPDATRWGRTWSGASCWRAIAGALPYLAAPAATRACDGGPSTAAARVRARVPAHDRRRRLPRRRLRARARPRSARLAADANGEADRLRALDMRARVDWAAVAALRARSAATPRQLRRMGCAG